MAEQQSPIEVAPPTPRRTFLHGAGLGAVAAAALPFAGCAVAKARGEKSVSRRLAGGGSREVSLRIAHFTDVHVKPEGNAPEGMRACLRRIHALDPLPDLIVNGGDAIMDALKAPEEKTAKQWEVWARTLEEECRIPMIHCLGNHDAWGWDKTKSETTGDEPRWGKKWAMEIHGLERPYGSHDIGGWHIVTLDSVQQVDDGGTYKPLLDDAQFQWLADDLAAVPSGVPVLVASHVPLLSVCHQFFYVGDDEERAARVLRILQHRDATKLSDLFVERGNVRACISGHIHLADRVDYKGITYYCNGAVSGNWWGGPFHDVPPAFGLVTLFADGRVENEIIPWEAGGAEAADGKPVAIAGVDAPGATAEVVDG